MGFYWWKRGGGRGVPACEAPPGPGRSRLSAHGYFSRNPTLANNPVVLILTCRRSPLFAPCIITANNSSLVSAVGARKETTWSKLSAGPQSAAALQTRCCTITLYELVLRQSPCEIWNFKQGILPPRNWPNFGWWIIYCFLAGNGCGGEALISWHAHRTTH